MQLSGLTAGGAGFTGTFDLIADSPTAANANLHLTAAEFVDASVLLSLVNQDNAAQTWAFQWTVTGGAATSDGVASGVINLYTDAAELN